ncbi:hypothetical protein [Bosea sp. BIWAKO-01]|uniref:hypothetical protein n=1 Tax=Bosea sp. BIWAKO-01 TaxID=506668 RepID=UPI000853CE33|nr:hypothetical protein [Bosea sp. BIWAKO-01]GAU80523.1 hypothetical protein BIWAKO_00409 [Bosea sp. BIWAKO-01]
MMRGTPSGGRTGGFILLEVLVGLILLSLTLGLFALTLSFASKVAEAGRLRDRGAEIAVGAAAISGWLAGALPLVQPRATERPLVMFEGLADRVSFVTLSNGDAQPGGILAITIASENTGTQGAGALVFGSSLMSIGAAALSAQNTGEVLARGVASATFSYFGAREEGAPGRWHDEWRNSERLPRLVSLRVRVIVERRFEEFELNFPIITE